jgi:hypothetical protein
MLPRTLCRSDCSQNLHRPLPNQTFEWRTLWKMKQ